MKIDDVSFHDDFMKGFKSEDEFIEAMGKEGYKHIYAGNGRTEALKKAYALHHPKAEVTEKPKLQNAGGGKNKA